MKFIKFIFFIITFCFNFQSKAQFIDTSSYNKDGNCNLINWELYITQHSTDLYNKVSPSSIKYSNFDNSFAESLNYNGSCWFRKQFFVDSNIYNKINSLNIELIGAAEIYLNKKLIKKIGVVSNDNISEQLLNSNNEVVSVSFNKNKINELLIHFSNHSPKSSYKLGGDNFIGLNIFIKQTDSLYNNILGQTFPISILGTILFVFFLTLSFFHTIIYLLNKKQKSNIYYSCFCIFVSLFILGLFGYNITSNFYFLRISGIFVITTPMCIFCILPFMLRSFFYLEKPKWYILFLLFSIICFLLFLFSISSVTGIFLLSLILLSSAESVRVLFLAFKQKKSGVKIIGVGLLFFVSFILLISLSLIISNNINVRSEGGWLSLLFLLFMLLSIFSIPISITTFLSYSISLTNKSLSKKLIEVEELSLKTIEQEKEKQHILENKKQELEVQVIERTKEITIQKQIIEDKNKDIIDSITYAKRIQNSILPTPEYFNSIFNNSFIFYLPKDIVSGDFYYLTEINNIKILFAADCTGHGVPGALMSMVGSNLLNKIIHENKIYDPKLILENLHNELRHALKQDVPNSTNRDGMDACLVTITDEELIYCGANRPLIYFDKENQLVEVKPTKTPIGGSHIDKINIIKNEINKDNIKEFYLFSDGFADQFGGSEGKKLMISRFKNWLTEISLFTTEQKLNYISTEFLKWKQNVEQVDDVMVIGVTL